MKLIVGLGNPGDKYKHTRHNAGFIILDAYANTAGLHWEEDKKFKCEKAVEGDTLFIKPQTFMNNSGDSVSLVVNFYKIALDDVIVLHDDVDLALGQVKFNKGSRSAGHHGVDSIIEKLGTNEFWRFRVGIGKPENKVLPIDEWVTLPFSSEELDVIERIKPPFLYK